MDEPETSIIANSQITGAMNYPSTTQALFALIVMIIVLMFILVYCCWGTFTCARQEDASAPSAEDGAGPNTQQGVRQILHGPHTVIMPVNNMIYVGDPETQQIYQIPLDRGKPPAYAEVFSSGPPPPYRPTAAASDLELSSSTTTQREQQDNRTTLPESPPTYDESMLAVPQESSAEQSLDTASCSSQQEGAATSEAPTDVSASAVPESPTPQVSEPTQEIQQLPPPRRDLILTVSTLPQVSSHTTEERLGNAPGEAQHLQEGNGD